MADDVQPSLTSRTDIVRRYHAAFTRRDLPTLLELLHPDVVFDPVLGILYSEHRYHGIDGMTRCYEELARDWDSFEILVEDAFDVDDHVVAFLHLIAHRGEESLDAQIATECRFTGERISSFVGREAWEVAEEIGVRHPAPARWTRFKPSQSARACARAARRAGARRRSGGRRAPRACAAGGRSRGARARTPPR